jgi:hypothetical protein
MEGFNGIESKNVETNKMGEKYSDQRTSKIESFFPASAINKSHFQLSAIRTFVTRGGQDKSPFAGIHQPGNCEFKIAHFRFQLQGWVIIENNVAAAFDAIWLVFKVIDDLKFTAVFTNRRCAAIVIEIQKFASKIKFFVESTITVSP